MFLVADMNGAATSHNNEQFDVADQDYFILNRINLVVFNKKRGLSHKCLTLWDNPLSFGKPNTYLAKAMSI